MASNKAPPLVQYSHTPGAWVGTATSGEQPCQSYANPMPILAVAQAASDSDLVRVRVRVGVRVRVWVGVRVRVWVRVRMRVRVRVRGQGPGSGEHAFESRRPLGGLLLLPQRVGEHAQRLEFARCSPLGDRKRAGSARWGEVLGPRASERRGRLLSSGPLSPRALSLLRLLLSGPGGGPAPAGGPTERGARAGFWRRGASTARHAPL